MAVPVIFLGEDATPEDVRALMDRMDLRDCQDPKTGEFVSPINGKRFEKYANLAGHVGGYMGRRKLKGDTPDHAGYYRRIRRGEKPTPEQRKANRDYVRANRAKHKAKQAQDSREKATA